ncbi:trans-aconitate 2-methyltransferase [Ferrovibrio sp.]|uniref:class I SAM-dependent methyltransferase n=1 Tax=Ferrovibrio sp. TaxID=1917215 RepID=UPI002614FFFE|nr:class I SAM-dependent methyltransferase [Ferrovibrio sp.]
MTESRQQHWQEVYSTKDEAEVSWFQDRPQTSLDLIAQTGLSPDASLIDIGGGASRLVDALLDAGWRDIAVLDIAGAALARAQARLGPRGASVDWIVADITTWQPRRRYDLWHDRAVFHFLTTAADRVAYKAALRAAVAPGGHVVIGSFAPDGPERCSGLPVQRYSPESLQAELGGDFLLQQALQEDHQTPAGRVQHFQFSRFRRV